MTGEAGSPRQDSNATEALVGIYQAERGDLGLLMGHNLSLISIGVAYMGISGAALLTSGSGDQAWLLQALGVESTNAMMPGWLALSLPLPPLLVLGFMVNMLANVFAHNWSVGKLESHLLDVADWPDEERPKIGARAGDAVTNLTRQPLFLKMQSVIAYGGIFVIVLGFSIRSLQVAAEDLGYNEVWIAISAIYAILFLLSILAWTLTLIRLNPGDPYEESSSEPVEPRQGRGRSLHLGATFSIDLKPASTERSD